MSEYLVIKRDKCGCPKGTPHIEGVPVLDILWGNPCGVCGNTGYKDTHVNLLDALNEMKATEITCDCEETHFGIRVMDSLLEWKCGDEIKRDTNA